MPLDILARNNVTVSGNGSQTLLFAHGFGCDQNMWRWVTPAFEDDYKIVLFDFVGSGKSDIAAYKPERYASLDGYATDILEVCAALRLRDIVFVGHSVSCIGGILASVRKPHLFKSLILVGPSPRYINDAPDYIGGFERSDIEELLGMMEKNYLGWASGLVPAVMGNPDRPELTQELEASFCSIDPEIARCFARTTFLSDNRADLPHVPVPSLVLQSADDLIAPLEVGEYMHRHLPNSELRVLKTTGHCPHISHPQETICAMKEYLASA